MVGFLSRDTGNLTEQLSQGMDRVAQYRTLQRGVDARSGNIYVGGGRIIIGKYAVDTYGIAYYDAYGNILSTNNGTTETRYYSDGIVSSTDDGTTQTKYDTSGDILSIDDGDKTVYYDSSDARILIGQSPTGVIGLWVSAVGEDVITLLS